MGLLGAAIASTCLLLVTNLPGSSAILLYKTGIDVQVAWNNCILITGMGLTESDVDMMGVFDMFRKVMSVA